MKRTAVTLALLMAATAASAAPWTYRGTLNEGGQLANGTFDLRVTLLNQGKTATVYGPLTLYDVKVVSGNFAAEVDFGTDLSAAPAMALKTEVQQGGSGFVALGDATPFDPKSVLAGVCWDIEGNSGTNPATNYMGTMDNQPLVLGVNSIPALRIFPADLSPNLVAGATGNSVSSEHSGQIVAGGGSPLPECGPSGFAPCRNHAEADYATVSGGMGNTAIGDGSSVGGGSNNEASGPYSIVAGGKRNTAGEMSSSVGGGNINNASGSYSTIGGGGINTASGEFSTVGGGSSNTAFGAYSTVGGGDSNCAGGDYSWAGGRSAIIRRGTGHFDSDCVLTSHDADGDNGTFVWSDDQEGLFYSTGQRQFLVRADGGVAFNTNSLGSSDDLVVAARAVSGDADSDVVWRSRSGKSGTIYLSDSTGGFTMSLPALTGANYLFFGNGARLTSGGVFTNASSRTLKEGFAAIDPAAVLGKLIALPISTWTYKVSAAEGLHLGPMAEDFKAAFGLAGDGKSIGTVDADGVALAAIQGLNAKLESENAALREEKDREIAVLNARLNALEARLSH